MNRQEAKKNLERGFRLTHRHFSDDEWVQKSKNYQHKYEFEDGNVCSFLDFWKYRNDDNFDKDWSIKPIYPIGFKFIVRHKPSIFSEEIIDEDVEIKAYDTFQYLLSNHLAYFINRLEAELKDGLLIDIRGELSNNDLR